MKKWIFFCLILLFIIGVYFVIKKDLVTYLLINDNREEIKIKNAYNNNDAYHPKIIKFDNNWNGYKYWMTFTPYYEENDQTENPHVVVSNDLKHWKTIDGGINPIEDKPSDGRIYRSYNSDSVLVYNNDTNELECWFRYINKDRKEVIIYRKNTKDGINYTDKQIIFKSNESIEKVISPAVIYESGTYKIWYVSLVNDEHALMYTESKDLINFTEPLKLDIDYYEDELITWHIDVSKYNNKYHMLISAYKIDGNPTRGMNLYYSNSDDGIKYKKFMRILLHRKLENKFDSKSIYKSTLLYDEDRYKIIYSSISRKEEHRIGIIDKTEFINNFSNNKLKGKK